MVEAVRSLVDGRNVEPLIELKAWKALKAHHEQAGALHLRDLFAADSKRGEKFMVEALGLFFDYSKNRVTGETIKLLIELARASGLQGRIEAMFRGDKINFTEGRAVLHTALRAPKVARIAARTAKKWLQLRARVDGAR